MRHPFYVNIRGREVAIEAVVDDYDRDADGPYVSAWHIEPQFDEPDLGLVAYQPIDPEDLDTDSTLDDFDLIIRILNDNIGWWLYQNHRAALGERYDKRIAEAMGK